MLNVNIDKKCCVKCLNGFTTLQTEQLANGDDEDMDVNIMFHYDCKWQTVQLGGINITLNKYQVFLYIL